MRLADSHIHLFPRGYSHDGGPALFGTGELATYEALRAAHHIDCALVIGYEADGIDPQNNAYIRRLGATHNWLRTLAYVDTHAGPTAEFITDLLDQGHSGLAIYATDDAKAQALLGWPPNIWEVLRSHGAIVSLNARPGSIALLRPVMEAADGVPILLSHLGLPGPLPAGLDDAALRIRLAPLLSLARFDNVHVKISGLYATSDPPFAYPHIAAGHCIRHILSAYGCDRCLWGSDFSPALEFVSFPQTIHWEGAKRLKEKEKNMIMRENLFRILRCA